MTDNMNKTTFFCIVSILAFFDTTNADTIDIQWGSDNQTYTTTTCTVGGDVLLPNAPTKRGYIFKGWQKDIFNRGTFANWDAVPDRYTEPSLYEPDYHNSRKPLNDDYVIITNASDYYAPTSTNLFNKPERTYYLNKQFGGNCTIGDDNQGRVIIDLPLDYLIGKKSVFQIIGDNFIIDGSCYGKTYNYFRGGQYTGNKFYSMADAYTNIDTFRIQLRKTNGTAITESDWQNLNVLLYTVDSTSNYSGTWKFVYDGVWGANGKNGWKPLEQVGN